MRRKLCSEILGRESINVDGTRSRDRGTGPQLDEKLDNSIPVNTFHRVTFRNTRNSLAIVSRDTYALTV